MANLHVNEGEMRQEEEANRRREAFWREAKRYVIKYFEN